MASSGSSGCPTQPHVAFVAFPFGTHAAPLFALARAVASAAPGAAVSFLSTARSLASLPRAEGLGNIRLVPVADGRPEGAAEVPPPGGIEGMIGMFLAATPGNLREALGAAAAGAGGIPVGCVVSDAFMWMAGDVAEAAGAPWVVLWTGGPAGLAAHLHTDLLRDAIGVGERAMTRFQEQLHSIPVLSAHRVCDLPEGIVFGPLDAPVSCLVHRMAQSLPKAAAVLHNTFEGLDPAIDAHFSATFSRSLPVGPLHLLAPPAHPTPDPNHCLPWLDRHGPATVAYVSFGSFMAPPPAEMTELAEGLEASGAAFLWSLRDEVMGLLPPGFSERTKGRGLVVSWAPQLDILRHAAVGAIVMHCGWNSVVEAITAGVPMVCRPFFGDQRLNARFIFQVWEIGVEFEGGVMTKEGVVRALEAVLKGEEGKRMRVKAGELKAIATRAVQPGGSSSVNFNSFLDLV